MNKYIIPAIMGLLMLPIITQASPTDDKVLKPCIIKGLIVDANKKAPLEFANIVLKRIDDSTMVSATVSGKTGEFIMAGVPNGTYFMRVSFVGYTATFIEDITITASTPEVNLGTVTMSESSIDIGDVTVEGERPMEEFHIDKKVINVSRFPAAAGGTALDVLRNQPSVQVDATDNVTLRGSSTFTVLVNGRPSVFQGTDALKQIPANIIETIELITNPSAKYDAEGAAGIININLKKESPSETRGIVNMTAGTRDKYSGDISLNHGIGPLSLSGGFEYRNNTYWQIQDIHRTADITGGDLEQQTDVDRRDGRKQYNLRLGAEYNMTDFDVVSLNASIGEVNMDRRFIVNVHNQEPGIDEYTNIHNEFDLSAPYVNTVFFYTHKFTPKVSELSIENNYTTVDIPYTQSTDEFATDQGFVNRQGNPLLTDQNTDNWRYENTTKIDYFHQFSEQGKIEIGAQSRFSFRHYDIGISTFDWDTDNWLVDEGRSNEFDYNNNIHAAYMTYSNGISDVLFQVGLRAEYMDRLLEQKTLTTDYAYDKLDWFPSGSVSKKFGEDQLQFSYSRRINRPSELALNPYPYYSDRYLTSAGNPELLPEYINSFELNYQRIVRGAFFSVQTYYRASTDAQWRSQYVDDDGHLTTAFGNFAETSSLGVELSSSYRAATWLRLDPNVNLFNYALKGDAFDETVDMESFTWTARLNTTFTLASSTILQLTGMYMSKVVSPQSEVEPRFYASIVLRQTFFSKALTATVSASNLFTTANYDVFATGANFTNRFLIKPEVPMVNLTLSYNINNYRSQRRPEDIDVNIGG